MKTQLRKQQQAGFTLYELMITLTIVGVVLSYGLVNLSDFNRNGRITATANDLLGAFHVARSESARAKANITICASANPMVALPQCGGTWDQGYIVFEDSGATDLQVDAGEPIIRRHDAVEDGVNLNFEGGATHFSYSPTGLGRTLGVASVSRVVMCDERGNVSGGSGYSTARLFVVTPLGRAAVLRETGQLAVAFGAIAPTCI